MGTAVGFWNTIAKFYAKQKISDPEAYKIKLDSTTKYFTPESKVLEFGCGTGSTAIYHSPQIKSILAIDYSQKMIEIAKQKSDIEQIENIEFRQGTLLDLPLKPRSFDIILGLNVLHLIPRYYDTIKRSSELLKPNGHFITSTACLADSPKLLKTFLPLGGKLGILPHVQFFDVQTLEKQMEEAGLNIVESFAPGRDQNVQFIIAEKIN